MSGYTNVDEAKWNKVLTYWLEQSADMGARGFYDLNEEYESDDWKEFLKTALDHIKGELI